MSYRVMQCQIAPDNLIYDYCDSNARKAKLLYNAALFRIRQIFTGWDKNSRTDNEKEVFAEVDLLQQTYPSIKVKKVISYCHLEKLMRVTHNPDFFAGLPSQSAQAVVKHAVTDFSNWLKSLKAYKQDPSKFLGKPQMPRYQKSDVITYAITNQDAVLYLTDRGADLKLPRTKGRLHLSNIEKDSVLKEVKIKPYYGRYILCLTFECGAPVANSADMPNICAIDFGVSNFATIVCNDGSSMLYKGGAVLADCQWFHKQKAKAVGIITKGHEHMHASSKYLTSLSRRHADFIKDQCHKISRAVINYCIEHRAGTLILGENKNWKQNSDMDSQNNQNFVSMPIGLLKQMIIYKAAYAGIKIIIQEESYTSKADITVMDYIPTYGIDDDKAVFSGNRLKRGRYKCSNGMIINSDCNGAANIMRKAIPDAWNGITDFSFLVSPEVSGFHELNPLSISVKGIAAA